MITRALRLSIIVTVLAASACEVVAGFDDFEPKAKSSAHPCDVLKVQDTWHADESRGGILVRVNLEGEEAQDRTCVWMDQTEVTVGEYKAWLQRPNKADFHQQRCLWKSSPGDPTTDANPCPDHSAVEGDPWLDQLPIRCVDWCDADAFCRSAGKNGRLCDVWSTAHAPDRQAREWVTACSEGGTFPYGNKLDETACNVGGAAAGAQVVNAKKNCETPSGVQDLIGNVAEWVRQCADANDGDSSRTCLLMGGSYETQPNAVSCLNLPSGQPVSYRGSDVGFRCCRGLSDEEKIEVAKH